MNLKKKNKFTHDKDIIGTNANEIFIFMMENGYKYFI